MSDHDVVADLNGEHGSLKRSELAGRVCCSWHSKYREAAMAAPEMSAPERLVHLSGHHLAAITRRRADGCASNVAFAKEQLDRLGWKPNAAGGCGTQRRVVFQSAPRRTSLSPPRSPPRHSS